jgi:glycosyltransferase involved in cell wall biosynthesis
MLSCSIVIAEYNNGKYFSDLYSSIITQDLIDFEVIIVDDCSTDDTVCLVEHKILHDSRFKLIKHTKNGGAGLAFKTALKHCNYEVVIMLGADDALTAKALEIIITSHVQYPNASLINFPFYYCDENLQIQSKSSLYSSVKEEGYIFWSSKGVDTFKKSKYLQTSGFDEHLRSAVDQDICFKLEETGDTIYIDEPVYLYRKNKSGISQGKNAFPAKLNHFVAMLNAFDRREITGFKNITHTQQRDIKVEYYFYKSFIQENQKKYFKTFLYFMYGFFLCKIYRVQLTESTQKEISYFKHRILKENRIAVLAKTLIKPEK